MPEVSLTDFVDFVIRAGIPKLTKVRDIKSRPEYSPNFDFWKTLRDGIREFHKNNEPLDNLLTKITDPKKLRRYPDAVRAYKKFLKSKTPEWFAPPSGNWVNSELTVRVNPELGLRLNSVDYVVKLYFKDEALTERRLAVVLQMMKTALKGKLSSNAKVAVLEVGKSKLIPLGDDAPDITPLLLGEAAAFVAMWNAI